MMNTGKIRKIVVEGAGTMGASIAMIFAEYGYEVTLHGRREESLEKAKHRIREAMEIQNKDPDGLTIRYTTGWDDFADCDLLVENISEVMETKLEYFRNASPRLKEDALIVTNTSGMSITKIAEAVVRPERFAGFHWFNPPHIIPLIEVVSGEKTAPETVEDLLAFAEAIGKKPIHVKRDVPGFIANRILYSIIRECTNMVDQGIGSMEDIDKCMKFAMGFRFACLGPFEVVDQGGLDVFYRISDYLFENLSDAKKPGGLFKKLFEEGKYGVKTGAGFYDYSGSKAEESVVRRDRMYLKLLQAGLHDEEEA